MLTLASWNVNSIRARLANVTAWIDKINPDVLLLQEIKCESHTFPHESFPTYNAAVLGQKSYNGVAILSRFPIEDIVEGIPSFDQDGQARYIEALIDTPQGVLRVASVYAPNGGTIGSNTYHYKLRFFESLRSHMSTLLSYEEMTIIGGDYNVAPTDADVYDAEAWRDQILCSTPERLALQSLLHLGYYDAIRLHHPQQQGPYTWWDYRGGASSRDQGLRIDHLLLSPLAIDAMEKAAVDREERAHDHASDHAPVWCCLKERTDLWHSQPMT